MSKGARAEQLAGGLIGLLIGDALGVPYEFHDPRNLPPPEQIEFEPPRDHRLPDGRSFHRSHGGVPPGTWSDDGAHALCLLASLQHCGGLDLEDLARRLRNWWDFGYMAVDRPFDIGNQTTRALLALESGTAAARAGPHEERDNGNGSLMRVLPLALWHRGSDRELVDDAMKQSLVTHGHPQSMLCCALYCLWARRLLDGANPIEEAWRLSVDQLQQMGRYPDQLEIVLSFDRPRGSGYVVDTLHSAKLALGVGPYEAVVRRAIAFGLDTDTTAAVAGGLAGLRDGLHAIPARWLGALRGRELVDPLLRALISS